MDNEVLAKRYAEALLDNIGDNEAMDLVHNELQVLESMRVENTALRAYFADPSVTEEDRRNLIHRVFEGKVQPVLLNFLDLLIHKHRLEHLGAIARSFAKLVEERRNQARIQIYTAIALPADVADRMKRALDRATGKDCILENKVDPKIIGGAIAVHGDRVFDGSVRTTLDEMRKQLMATAI